MGKTLVIYIKFLHDVAYQKLLKSANVSRSYSKNNTGSFFSETRCSDGCYIAQSVVRQRILGVRGAMSQINPRVLVEPQPQTGF